jgi:hypothetical protein
VTLATWGLSLQPPADLQQKIRTFLNKTTFISLLSQKDTNRCSELHEKSSFWQSIHNIMVKGTVLPD